MVNWLARLVGIIRPVPEPDTSRPGPPYGAEVTIDMLYSESKRRRCVITRGRDGLYRLHEELWTRDDWNVLGEAFWGPVGETSITDRLSNATRLAREALSSPAGPGDRT